MPEALDQVATASPEHVKIAGVGIAAKPLCRFPLIIFIENFERK